MALLDTRELSVDELQKVSGGYLYMGDGVKGVEVIDDHDGHLITTFRTSNEAYAYCKEHGLSVAYLLWDQLLELREKSSK